MLNIIVKFFPLSMSHLYFKNNQDYILLRNVFAQSENHSARETYISCVCTSQPDQLQCSPFPTIS